MAVLNYYDIFYGVLIFIIFIITLYMLNVFNTINDNPEQKLINDRIKLYKDIILNQKFDYTNIKDLNKMLVYIMLYNNVTYNPVSDLEKYKFSNFENLMTKETSLLTSDSSMEEIYNLYYKLAVEKLKTEINTLMHPSVDPSKLPSLDIRLTVMGEMLQDKLTYPELLVLCNLIKSNKIDEIIKTNLTYVEYTALNSLFPDLKIVYDKLNGNVENKKNSIK